MTKSIHTETTTISIAFIAMASLLLLWQLFPSRSLFLDEANLIRNIYEKSALDLFLPLDYEQYAAPFFLIIQKMFCLTLGTSEWVFRILSLLAGIGSLWLLFSLLKNRIHMAISILVALLLLCNPYCLRYFTECKQYGVDLFVCLFLLRLFDPNRQFSWTSKLLSILIAPWLSMSSVFVIFSIALVRRLSTSRETLGAQKGLFQKSRREVIVAFTPFILSALSFFLYYWSNLRESVGTSYLSSVHEKYFPFLIPSNTEQWQQSWDLFLLWFAQFGNHTVLSFIVTIGLFLLGAIVTYKRDRYIFWFGILLLLSCWVASGFQLYLWRPRTLLFTQAVFYLFCAYGLDAIWRWKSGNFLALVSFILLLFFSNSQHPFWQKLQVTDYRAVSTLIKDESIHLVCDPSSYPVMYYEKEIKRSFQNTKLSLASSSELAQLNLPQAYFLRGADWAISQEKYDNSLHAFYVLDTIVYSNIAFYHGKRKISK